MREEFSVVQDQLVGPEDSLGEVVWIWPVGIRAQCALTSFIFAIRRQLLRQVGARWEEELAVGLLNGTLL